MAKGALPSTCMNQCYTLKLLALDTWSDGWWGTYLTITGDHADDITVTDPFSGSDDVFSLSDIGTSLDLDMFKKGLASCPDGYCCDYWGDDGCDDSSTTICLPDPSCQGVTDPCFEFATEGGNYDSYAAWQILDGDAVLFEGAGGYGKCISVYLIVGSLNSQSAPRLNIIRDGR